GGRRKSHLARHVPDTSAFHVMGCVAAAFGIDTDPFTLDLLDLFEQVQVDAFVIHDVTGGVGAGDDGCSQPLGLLDRVDRDVARTGDHHAAPVQALSIAFQHAFGEQYGSIARCFGTDTGTTPTQTLARDHTGLPAVGQAPILAEHVTDLACSHTDVSGRDVGVLTQVAVEFGHERLAEPLDLGLRAALGVEVTATLASADVHTGQGVFEDLLEPEELDHTEVDAGVEAQTSLVGAKSAVELHPEAAVDVHAALVVTPGNPEDDLSLGLAQTFQNALLDVFGVGGKSRGKAVQYLEHRLLELGLVGVASDHMLVGRSNPRVAVCDLCKVRHGGSFRCRSVGEAHTPLCREALGHWALRRSDRRLETNLYLQVMAVHTVSYRDVNLNFSSCFLPLRGVSPLDRHLPSGAGMQHDSPQHFR